LRDWKALLESVKFHVGGKLEIHGIPADGLEGSSNTAPMKSLLGSMCNGALIVERDLPWKKAIIMILTPLSVYPTSRGVAAGISRWVTVLSGSQIQNVKQFADGYART